MQLIRCTQKLLKELAVAPVAIENPSGPLGPWHANLLRIQRRKCVLFTNDSTLFSLFVPGLRKPEFEQLPQILGQSLFRALRLEDFSQQQIEVVLDEIKDLQFAKTNSRSVLGSMNDLAYQVIWIIDSMGGLEECSVDVVNHEINRNPLRAIDPHVYSIDALRHKLDA
jgi:hypothetical protein